MLNRNIDLKSSIHSTSEAIRDAVGRAEQRAVETVERAQQSFADLQSGVDKTRDAGGNLMAGLNLAGRTTWSGFGEIAEKLAEHGRLAVNDTVEMVRATSQATCWRGVLAAQAEFASRRTLAAFEAIDDLNQIGRDSTVKTWQPLGAKIDEITRQAPVVSMPVTAKVPSARKVKTSTRKVVAKRMRKAA